MNPVRRVHSFPGWDMIATGFLLLIIGGAHGPLTADLLEFSHIRSDSVLVAAAVQRPELPSVDPRLAFRLQAPLDTPRTRRRAIQVSDWYSRRLMIHRYVAYATIPVFAMQWMAGNQLFDKGAAAPTWAKTTHRVGATALAGMFTVNTVTGAWNWWDSRALAKGRVLRTIHAVSILAADGAFTYAGVKLSDEAETSADKRQQHKTIALSAMGVTVASGIVMKLFNR
jgi:hypothetical protein